jgi:hypothetical protein
VILVDIDPREGSGVIPLYSKSDPPADAKAAAEQTLVPPDKLLVS